MFYATRLIGIKSIPIFRNTLWTNVFSTFYLNLEVFSIFAYVVVALAIRFSIL